MYQNVFFFKVCIFFRISSLTGVISKNVYDSFQFRKFLTLSMINSL